MIGNNDSDKAEQMRIYLNISSIKNFIWISVSKNVKIIKKLFIK